MKFGPVIGDRLASSVLDGGVHPDLAGPGRTTPVTASSTPAYWTTLSRSPRNATESSATIAG